MKVASGETVGPILAGTDGPGRSVSIRADGDDRTGGGERTSIVERVDEVLQRDYERAESDVPASDRDAGGASGQQPSEHSDRAPGARPDADDAEEPEECQNCGATDEGCDSRELGPNGLSVVLCRACHAAREDSRRSREDCRQTGVPLAAAGAEACEACGASASLEPHAVVPMDAGGHRHANNLLALCPDCHATVTCHRDATE